MTLPASSPPPPRERVTRSRLALAVLLAGTALGYPSFLARSPIYLNNAEVAFAVQAGAIASTAHDINGHFLPLYFNMLPGVWYHPVIVYWMAAFLRVLPLGEFTVRLGTVAVAVLDVALV